MNMPDSGLSIADAALANSEADALGISTFSSNRFCAGGAAGTSARAGSATSAVVAMAAVAVAQHG